MVNPKVGKRDNDACLDLASGEPSGKLERDLVERGHDVPGTREAQRVTPLSGAESPRLVLVREPDQLGLERAHP
jgi:hypothetical protein